MVLKRYAVPFSELSIVVFRVGLEHPENKTFNKIVKTIIKDENSSFTLKNFKSLVKKNMR